MNYSKILSVHEDEERVYFTFYNQSEKKIIGIPKNNCQNKAIYFGATFDKLTLIDSNNAMYLLNEYMKISLISHPSLKVCDNETVKLLM